MTHEFGVFIQSANDSPSLIDTVSTLSVAKQRAHRAAELAKVVSFVVSLKSSVEHYRVYPFKPQPLWNDHETAAC